MARPLSELQVLMKGLPGVLEAYIQPPSTMKFPSIMIERAVRSDISYADNIKYLLKKGYTITVVDRAPDSPIPDQVEALPHCVFDRKFVSDGLHHFVFQLFF